MYARYSILIFSSMDMVVNKLKNLPLGSQSRFIFTPAVFRSQNKPPKINFYSITRITAGSIWSFDHFRYQITGYLIGEYSNRTHIFIRIHPSFAALNWMLFVGVMEVIFIWAAIYFRSPLFLVASIIFFVVNLTLLFLLGIIPRKAIRNSGDAIMQFLDTEFGENGWKIIH